MMDTVRPGPARLRRTGLLGRTIAAGMLCAAWAPLAAQAMEFHEVPPSPGCEPVCLVAEGEIDSDTAKKFRQTVRGDKARGATIVVDSLGGLLLLGIGVGETIRKLGLATAVGRYDAEAGRFGPGTCASACVYIFMGGTRRSVVPGSRIGVHQVRMNSAEASFSGRDAQLLMARAGDQLVKSGASSELLVLALATPPEDVRWLKPSELVRLTVVTAQFGSDAAPPPAEVQAADSDRQELPTSMHLRLLAARVPESRAR